ncbi:MAG: sugar phosphate isomerase/epimerase [Clostridia bacterium]|nr:sugar phosphate isomerase/epimerase [Clostridia bacterium]
MKEIRLCDDGNLETTSKLSIENNLGIEVQGFHDPYITNKDELLEQCKKVFKNIKGGKSLHAPFWDLNIGTKMKLLRQETMNMFNYIYDIAKELNCTEIVIHNGYIPGTYYQKAWIERAKKFWEEFFEKKDNSITMCIENQFEEDSQIMKEEIDLVNDPRLKICLDIGHANANSNMKVEDWITSLGDRIAYLHLHNNHGKQYKAGYNNDEHFGLNNGNINIENVLNLLEQYCPNAIWNLEPHTQYLEESIEVLKKLNYIC